VVDRCAIPAVYALLCRKTKETYVQLFQTVKNENPNWLPNSVITDFEQGAIEGIREVKVFIYFDFLKINSSDLS
jgi:hypothetical protein